MHYLDERGDESIITLIDGLAGMINRDMTANGFDLATNGQPEAVDIALMHSELSEALEAIRYGNPPDQHCPEFTSAEIEYADLIIRVLHTCAARKHRIGQAIIAKGIYNRTRAHKHGKSF